VFVVWLTAAKKFDELHGQKGGKKDKTPQKPQQQEKKKAQKPEVKPAQQVISFVLCRIGNRARHFLELTLLKLRIFSKSQIYNKFIGYTGLPFGIINDDIVTDTNMYWYVASSSS